VIVLVLFGAFLVGAAGFAALALSPQRSPAPSGGPSNQIGDASAAPGSTTGAPQPSGSDGRPGSTVSPSETSGPGATSSPPGTPAPTGDVAMPFVPVVDFWSTASSMSMRQISDALKGRNGGFDGVIVPSADRAALGQALGFAIADSVKDGDAAAIVAAVKGGSLGLMRAADVVPTVRALGIGGASLFGESRIRKLADWPLVATVRAPLDHAWDQGRTWTLLAGGDMFLDRGVRNTVLVKGKGIDYPFDGGSAVVTGHCRCSPSVAIPNGIVPTVRKTGDKGAVRALVRHADLAIANLENPIPDNPSWHLGGLVFGGPPKTLPMFTNAGIDWVTLANNHINDYGDAGIQQTIANLDKYGIPHGGAGKGIAGAGQVSYLKAAGTKIAIIACVAVVPTSFASGTSNWGGLPCDDQYVLPRIQQARQRADLVIIFPHWGVEYRRDPTRSQQQLAQDWVAGGADLILGSHSHYFGALQDIDGHAVLYSMGNFIFDQYWSTPTMESALPEMTFEGSRLLQIRLHPDVILDQAQPNLLNPATDDGKALLAAVRAASDRLGW